MPTTPARTTKKKTPAKPVQDIELVGEIDEESESFRGRLFGDQIFRFSTDVNGFLLLNAVRGGGEFIDLLDSLVLLDDDIDETDPRELELLREAEKDRFHGALAAERHFSVERLARLVADVTEIAGNEDGETSSSD